MTLEVLGVWTAAFLTLAVYTYVFGDNPVYRFAEHTYIAVATGYGFILQIDNMIRPTIKKSLMQDGQWHLLIPMLLGLLIYARYFKPINYLSRYTVAFMVGVGAGVVLTRDFKSYFLLQLTATGLNVTSGPQAFNNLLLVIGVVTTLVYFFFTIEPKGVIGAASRVGRMTMMIALGAAFGNTVMGRVSLFLGRLQFLLGPWLGLLKE